MRWLAALLLVLWAMPLAAQDAPPAILIADDVTLTRDRQLIATGNVEAFQGTTRLTAAAIRYDGQTGTLDITGPITIEDGEDIIILADQAQLSRDLRNGLLQGARLVLNDQLQLAAVEMNRVGGRYTQLYKTAVTSCRVCETGRPPLWSIRAKRVVHDQQERQLYFDGAQFRIGAVPILYLPRLRMPDPTLERATGFLIPSLRSTSQLGTGIKVPYFIKLGDSRDLTLTPYLSSSTETLEFRYRQAFTNGRIEFNGAYTRDDLRPGEARGYLFGFGTFNLGNDYVLTFDIETTSDDAYLTEYSYSEKDRLDSAVTLTRAKRDELRQFSFVNYKTLRDGENNATLPTNIFDAVYERRMFPRALGGELRLTAAAHSHVRTSTVSVDGPDADLLPDGRDVYRVNVGAEWTRSWSFASGLQMQALLGLEGDAFRIAQDSTTPDNAAGLTPEAALTFRYPMTRTGARGTQLLEPILQIAWVGGSTLAVPIEESARVEFDEGNLLALSRFPRPDARERGTFAALGVNWSYFGDSGLNTRLSLGQVIRNDPAAGYTLSSGLGGTSSDVLVAAHLSLAGGLSLTGRALIGGDFHTTKAELRGGWSNRRARLSGSYIWLTDDLAEDRPDPVSELTLDGAFNIDKHWSATADVRYDLDGDRATYAGIGLTYDNECVSARLSVNRRYTSSTSVEPSTNVGFTVSLRGFSAQTGTESYARTCK
ncbi:MAG: LPS assembly protein LptD [Pseudomonadota bacterium]